MARRPANIGATTKTCRICEAEKPLEEFHKVSKGGHLGRHAYCKECDRERRARQHQERRELGLSTGDTRSSVAQLRVDKWIREQQRPCGICGVVKPFSEFPKGSSRAGVKFSCKACGASARLEAKYGITTRDYEALVAAQGGRCAICGTDRPMGRHPDIWKVDHCHETGRVRGLLCHSCNIGLGSFQDSIPRMKKAIEYLTQPQGN